MSILERPASPHARAAEGEPPSDRLRVIMAGRVGNMDASLGASGFDVVAVAQTQDALIDAVSADEPDAIVVEADMCTSLEHVRDLAPDAVLIVVGDHTPAGALGRIEPGVSGTVMARLLHALVAEGAGAAAVWGLVPAFQPGAEQHVLHHMGGSLLWAKADLVRGFLLNAVNALRDHAELVTAGSTVAVAVSAGVLLTLSGPRTEERPARVLVPASAVERAPVEPAEARPVFAVSPTTPHLHPWSLWQRERARRSAGPNRDDSRDLDRHDGPGENEYDQGEENDDQGVNEGSDDQVVYEGDDDQVVDEGNDPHGKSEDLHGQSEDPHGKSEDPHSKSEDPLGQNEADHGQNDDLHGQNEGDHAKKQDDHGVNQDNDDQGQNESEGDQAEVSDDRGEIEDDQGEDESNDDQGEDTDPITPL
jgi:hypothetical protein